MKIINLKLDDSIKINDRDNLQNENCMESLFQTIFLYLLTIRIYN
jgi:hypothetical protein